VDQTKARHPSTQESTIQKSSDMYICALAAKTFKGYRHHTAASVTGHCPNALKIEKKLKVLLPKRIVLLSVSRLCPFVLLLRVTYKSEYV
jgi:hypothetical protein